MTSSVPVQPQDPPASEVWLSYEYDDFWHKNRPWIATNYDPAFYGEVWNKWRELVMPIEFGPSNNCFGDCMIDWMTPHWWLFASGKTIEEAIQKLLTLPHRRHNCYTGACVVTYPNGEPPNIWIKKE